MNSWYELMGVKKGKIRNISLMCVCTAPPSAYIKETAML